MNRRGARRFFDIRRGQQWSGNPDGTRGSRADGNVLRGVVTRASYLGAGVGYEVAVAGVTLRVAVPAAQRVAPGTPVTLVVPIARGLPLPAA